MDWIFTSGGRICATSSDILTNLIPAFGLTTNRIELIEQREEQEQEQEQLDQTQSSSSSVSSVETNFLHDASSNVTVPDVYHARSERTVRLQEYYHRRQHGRKHVESPVGTRIDADGDVDFVSPKRRSNCTPEDEYGDSSTPVSTGSRKHLIGELSGRVAVATTPPTSSVLPTWSLEDIAASVIQAQYRGYRARIASQLKLQLRRERNTKAAAKANLVYRQMDAICTIQAHFRGYRVRRTNKATKEEVLLLEYQQFVEKAHQPCPGFVMRIEFEGGQAGHVSVCGHFAVSDALSAQGVTGCPFVVITDPVMAPEDTLRACTVVLHPKYLFLALDDPLCAKLELALRVILLLNLTLLADHPASLDYQFVDTENNYFGEFLPQFVLPEDMPPPVVFTDMTVNPRPGLVIQTRQHDSNAAVYINIVHHQNIPRFPLDNPYIMASNERGVIAGGGTSGSLCGVIIDAAVSSATWRAACETETVMKQVCRAMCC